MPKKRGGEKKRGDSLATYRSMRDFRKSPEPSGKGKGKGKSRWKKDGNPVFVVQKHDASVLHYDFRIEAEGVLKSWAVPKGPSTDPREKRLAVEVEDHPLDYGDFEGTIDEGNYGAGAVIVWDAGPYRNLDEEVSVEEAIEKGRLKIWLEGKKIRGGYTLVRTSMGGKKRNWLLMKRDDEEADARRNPTRTEPRSVLTGRTVEEVAEEEASG